MARKLAVEFVKKYEDQRVLVKVAYAIGKKEPVMIQVERRTDSGEYISSDIIDKETVERFYPENIIKELDLLQPNYEKLSM